MGGARRATGTRAAAGPAGTPRRGDRLSFRGRAVQTARHAGAGARGTAAAGARAREPRRTVQPGGVPGVGAGAVRELARARRASLRAAAHAGAGLVMGCLTAPFRLLGCLVLVAALGLGWLYRDRLEHEARRVIDRVRGVAPPSGGRAGVSALESANAKVDSLNGWRADSVVLTPSEFASLVGSGMDPQLRGQLDSLRVELLDGEIRVSARLRTAALSPDLIGPLAGALGPSEPVDAAGPLRVTRAGAGGWRGGAPRPRDIGGPGRGGPRAR